MPWIVLIFWSLSESHQYTQFLWSTVWKGERSSSEHKAKVSDLILCRKGLLLAGVGYYSDHVFTWSVFFHSRSLWRAEGQNSHSRRQQLRQARAFFKNSVKMNHQALLLLILLTELSHSSQCWLEIMIVVFSWHSVPNIVINIWVPIYASFLAGCVSWEKQF